MDGINILDLKTVSLKNQEHSSSSIERQGAGERRRKRSSQSNVHVANPIDISHFLHDQSVRALKIKEGTGPNIPRSCQPRKARADGTQLCMDEASSAIAQDCVGVYEKFSGTSQADGYQ